jgi:IS5 family transposase
MSPARGFADAFADPRLGTNEVLDRVGSLVDWGALEGLAREVRPGVTGRPPYAPLGMLKALYLQAMYDLSDPGLEAALLDRVSFRMRRRCAGSGRQRARRGCWSGRLRR